MTAGSKKDQTSEAALQAVEDALSLDISPADLAAEISAADAGAKDNSNVDFDPDFAELESKLAEAANDLRQQGEENHDLASELAVLGSAKPEKTRPEKSADAKLAGSRTNASQIDETQRGNSSRRQAAELPVKENSSLSPANDDKRNDVADLVYSMQRQAAPHMYWAAGLISLAWLAGCGALYWFGIADGSLKAATTGTPVFFGLVALALVPVLLFWAFAMLVRRAQEMRLAARTMTEAAIRLLQPEDIATDALVTVGRAIRREVASIGDGVERALGRASELETLVQSEVRNLERSYTDSEIRLRGLVAELAGERNEIITHAEKLKGSLAFAHTGLTDELDQVTGRVQNSIDEATLRMSDALASRHETITSTLQEAGNNLVSLLSASGEELQGALSLASGQARNTLIEKAQEMGKQVNLVGQAVATLLETRTASIREAGETVTRQIEVELGARALEFQSRLDLIDENIGTHSKHLLETLGTQSDQLSSRLGGLEQIMSTRGTTLVESLGMRVSALDQVLGERTAAIGDVIGSRLSGFGQSLTSEIEKAVNQLGDRHQSLETVADRVSQAIDSRASRIEETLRTRTAELAKAFTDGDQSVRKTIEYGLAGSKESANRIAVIIEERNKDFAWQIDTKAASLADTINQGAANLIGGIEKRANVIGNAIDERTRNFTTELDKRADLLTHIVDEKSRVLTSLITTQTQHVGDMIDQKSERLGQILAERASAINASLGTGLLATQRTIEDKTGELNRLLSERVRELNDVLENQAKPVVEAITARGNDVSVRLGALHKAVASDVTELLSNLAGTSDKMQNMLDIAGPKLSTMQTAIAAQARELTQSVEKASRDVSLSTQVAQGAQQKMDTTATGMVTTISGIAERFEEQGMMLQHATRLIDAAQTNFAATLEEKQESLHALASGLVERTETIERTMASFGEMLRKSLDEVAEKSRGVGAIVSTEIGTAIDQANMRFSKSVEIMRQAASDVQHDLEETREQMRRGVLELPDETRESAEAMRQVVADQISALRDLSEIVARSGKAVEMPVTQRLAAGNERTAASTSSGGGFGRGRAPAASGPSLLAPRRADPPARAFEAPRPAAPRPAAANSGGRLPEAASKGGWVSDLLRRASRDDEDPARRDAAPRQSAQRPASASPQLRNTRSPAHVVESLNSLSMDIARAIDHDAFIELWDRYQRGERNVFTRRLYTLQGEQTFDEIKSKYADEADFRIAVDRYITDFENLLADVSRNDRDNMMTQTYLTSDTGKVYTMLAHAAGRLTN